MKHHGITLTLLQCLCCVLAAQNTPSPHTPIEGVWRVVEAIINQRTLSGTDLGAGFYIFTGKHFSVVRESDKMPRPDIADTDLATADQLRKVWGPFVAQIGTYEINGDLLVEKILVSKNPSNMGPTGVSRRRFKIEGNTLTTEPYETLPGRIIRLKMIRVE